MSNIKYTSELLRPLVERSHSYTDVCRLLGLSTTGGSVTLISRKIRAYGLDISHFTGSRWNKGRKQPSKDPMKLLVRRNRDQPITGGTKLYKALVGIGRLEICVSCGLGSEWNGKPLKLQVDHEDGNRWNDTPDNLRFLCPNCHSQTSTFAGRNQCPRTPTAERHALEA